MFVSRYLGRALFAAAKSETSAAAAAAGSSARKAYNPLEEFFEVDRSPDEDKPVVYGTTFSLLFFYCSLSFLIGVTLILFITMLEMLSVCSRVNEMKKIEILLRFVGSVVG